MPAGEASGFHVDSYVLNKWGAYQMHPSSPKLPLRHKPSLNILRPTSYMEALRINSNIHDSPPS